DVLNVVAGHDFTNLGFKLTLADATGDLYSSTAGSLNLSGLAANTTYYVRVETWYNNAPSGIPVDYRLDFLLAAGADAAEPNDTPAAAYAITGIPSVG